MYAFLIKASYRLLGEPEINYLYLHRTPCNDQTPSLGKPVGLVTQRYTTTTLMELKHTLIHTLCQGTQTGN